jgi:intein/homing endonuclease
VSGSSIIETEYGQKTVEDVFNGNDEYILAYNHELNKPEFSKISEKFKNAIDINDKNNTKKWLQITLKSGKVIKVTDNHRIYLPDIDSYREAKLLTVGDILLSQ